MLHVGNIDIVAFLNKFPATEHDCNTLKLDTSFFADNMLKLSVIGIFREGKTTDKVRPMRSFQRVFTCVPVDNERIAIANEQLTITNLSHEQSKVSLCANKINFWLSWTFFLIIYFQMFKEEALKSQMEVIPVEQHTKTSSGSDAVLSDDQIKQQMIARFFRETNLTLTWSKE